MKKIITGIMLAIMAMSILICVPNVSSASTQTKSEWVRMNGNVTDWNMTNGTTTKTYGWLIANAAIINKNGTIHEWAMVQATWSDILRAYPMDEHPLGGSFVNDTVIVKGGNFSYTFSFYTAKLLNVTELSFNKTLTGNNFYLTGYWNVSEVTETINITWSDSWSQSWSQFNKEINITTTETPVVTNATGTLLANWTVPTAHGPWSGPLQGGGVGTFELSIDRVGTLSGFAVKSIMSFRELNICDIVYDASGDPRGTVDIYDLVKVAQHYGEVPGFSNYDPTLDVNGNGRIDIGDLTTIAANIQG